MKASSERIALFFFFFPSPPSNTVCPPPFSSSGLRLQCGAFLLLFPSLSLSLAALDVDVVNHGTDAAVIDHGESPFRPLLFPTPESQGFGGEARKRSETRPPPSFFPLLSPPSPPSFSLRSIAYRKEGLKH